jgi:3-oxoacyl-[acyl-carrier-protein] synthase-3
MNEKKESSIKVRQSNTDTVPADRISDLSEISPLKNITVIERDQSRYPLTKEDLKPTVKIPIAFSGCGVYVPEKVITNAVYAAKYGIKPEYIKQLTGISERRHATKEQACSDVAVGAVKSALKDYPELLKDVDLIIFSSMGGDYSSPPTSCIIQNKLKLYNTKTFDIIASCTSFVQSLQVASLYLNSGISKKTLLISADVTSKGINPYDLKTSILFGDGGACFAVTKDNTGSKGIVAQDFGTDGSKWEVATVKGGATTHPFAQPTEEDQHLLFQMKGKELFKTAIDKLQVSVKKVLDEANVTLEDIDHFVPHQANYRIITYLMKKLEVPDRKVCLTLQKYGNTATSSIPITLAEYLGDGTIKENNLVMLIGFGAGFNWGIILLRV